MGTVEAARIDVARHELPGFVFQEASGAGDAPVHPQLSGSAITGNHDARFDLYLTHRHIQPDQRPHNIAHLFGRVLNEQCVGTLVNANAATLSEQPKTVTTTQQLC